MLVGHDTTQRCTFSTPRLLVGDWHRVANEHGLDLVEVVRSVLTTATTAALPPEWHGDFDHERARQWVAARDAESPTRLAFASDSGQPIGLLILFESAGRRDPARVELRLGYVLAESAWGEGLASELVGGLVDWARSEPSIETISGGVAKDNAASARVLLKNGFEPATMREDEQIYELILR